MEQKTRNRRIPNFRLKIDRPERMLEAGLEVFTLFGFDRGRLEDIGQRVGLTRAAVYYYFPSKEFLAARLVERYALPEDYDPGEAEPRAALEQALASGRPARVLAFVLTENRALPELGIAYRRTLVDAVSRWPAVGDPALAEDIVDSALSAAAFRKIFGGVAGALPPPGTEAPALGLSI